ncbi:MAG: aminotransferase class III-fold pyridoxal phosphate-dependent enzyme, partial [Bdellovibrionia bacterium]
AGNPWATIQAAETLRILEEEDIKTKATEFGKIIMGELKEFQKTSRIVGDVRGKGLLIGIELVKDRKTKAYGTEETLEVMEQAKERGLLLGKGGLYGNVIRITPPMCITGDDALDIVRILRDSIQATEQKMGY